MRLTEGNPQQRRKGSSSEAGNKESGNSRKNCFSRHARSNGLAWSTEPPSSMTCCTTSSFSTNYLYTTSYIKPKTSTYKYALLTRSSLSRADDPGFRNKPSTPMCFSTCSKVSIRKLGTLPQFGTSEHRKKQSQLPKIKPLSI